MEKTELLAVLEKHGIRIESEFVPWSQSRNKDAKDSKGKPMPSLNWKVTIMKGSRTVLTTEYMAGSGHCPAYSAKMPASWSDGENQWRREAVAFECEKGRKALYMGALTGFRNKSEPILPNPLDVMYSLLTDSGTIDFATFEDWAYEFGYETDSRSAEKTYRACMEIALKLRNGLGEAVIAELREAFQDY